MTHKNNNLQKEIDPDQTIKIFSITGMTCFSCAKKIETIFKNFKGVIDVRVDFAQAEAMVTYDPSIVKHHEFSSAIEAHDYKVTDIRKPDKQLLKEKSNASPFFRSPWPYMKGLIAFFTIIGFYLGLLTLTSEWVFAKMQFEDYWVWILLLATGLGIQVFLYSILRSHIKKMQLNGAKKTVAVSGGLSTAGMAACCAHYLVTVLPVLGVPFVTTTIASIAEYQTIFFFIGVLSNIGGIIFMLNLMRKNNIVVVPVFLNKVGQHSKPIAQEK
jgi:copper chaperone CopZ